MRRLAFVFAASAALAFPSVAATAAGAAGDGSLVVQNGSAPWTGPGPGNVPVVQLTITGSVIGRVAGYGRIIIDPGSDPNAAFQVIGAGRPADSKRSETAQIWTATDFKFRAVNGTFTIVIYGSDVNLIAAGKGLVRLAGDPDAPRLDGTYSLNDGEFRSLPSVQTPKMAIGTVG